MHNSYQLGEKYEFPLLFSSPFNHFFPQRNMLFGHTEKYTPLEERKLLGHKIKKIS